MAKAKQAAEAPAKPNAAELVDELGAIEKELAPLRGKIKRAELLRQTIRGLTDDKTNQVDGAKFVAILGPRADKTVVDYYGLAKRIGLDRYAQFATASLEAIGQHVKPGILPPYLKTEQTGTRSLQVLEKGLTDSQSTGQALSPDKSASDGRDRVR